MSELIEIKIPDIGADNVDVIEVLMQSDTAVNKEQTLLIMEGDKATMDLPSNEAGIIKEVLVKVGDKVSKGSLVALLQPKPNTEIVNSVASPTPQKTEQSTKQPVAQPAEIQTTPADKKQPIATSNNNASDNHQVHATPGVRLFARELGVDLSQITQGSGRKGRILREDVQAYVKKTLTQPTPQGGNASIAPIPIIDFSQFGETNTQAINKIKQLTGEHMLRVCLNVPMVTQHDEADITNLEAFRKINNEKVKRAQTYDTDPANVKLTGLVFIIKALVATMTKFPVFNSSLAADGKSLIYKKYFNIGIAVDTPNGLTVPVIHGADKMQLNQLSQVMSGLSHKAREGKLLPTDMQGGCMTISSLGGIGGTAFTPIVNAPEVAILGVSRAKTQAVWNGNEWLPRLMLPLDLTYDHRVIDGAEAARFLVVLSQYLADVRFLLL